MCGKRLVADRRDPVCTENVLWRIVGTLCVQKTSCGGLKASPRTPICHDLSALTLFLYTAIRQNAFSVRGLAASSAITRFLYIGLVASSARACFAHEEIVAWRDISSDIMDAWIVL